MSTVGKPLVSIIITTFNHGQYIEKAIKSALAQSYTNTEIIIVDDGSTDNTEQIVKSFSGIVYFHQKNGGLSNARNTGIRICKGEYIVFLDADDWLFPEAVRSNVALISINPTVGFVGGRHYRLHTSENLIYLSPSIPTDKDYYQLFLAMGNFVQMHAAVMFKRKILLQYFYNESLRTCEDYDIYLRISRRHPILFHDEIIAAYRIHNSNMSSNVVNMLKDALFVLKQQLPYISSPEESQAFKKGQNFWVEFYLIAIQRKLYSHYYVPTKAESILLLKRKPFLFFRHMVKLLVKKK